MNKIIKNSLILAAITLIAGLLLGAAHQVTLEPIQKQQEKEKQESCQNVFPEAASFEEVTMSDAEQAELTAALIGHGFEAQTIDELLLAKDASGATIGLVEIISTTEGYGGGISSRWELHRTERQKESLSCHFPRRPALVCVPTQTISRISSRIKT